MIKNFIKKITSFIADPEREFSERIFLGFTFITELAVFIALIGDFIIGEDIKEIFLLIGILVVVPVITIICLYLDKLRIAIRIIVGSLIFIILPGLYFFGGGMRGGGVIWGIFACLYAGLLITGVWRVLILLSIFSVSIGCVITEFNYPQLVVDHTDNVFVIDTMISIILVGFVAFMMTMFQNRLFKDENKRAKKEAERAEELTRSQNRFFSSMSHEIRTPINSILGLNEVILRDQNASDEIIKEASGIQGAGKMLLALINDILDFSKIEAGSMDIVPVDYRVGDMLSEIVNMIWLRANDKGLRFNVSVDPDVPSVLYGDEVRIKQIMINLLNNAVKYTAEGAVELHIESSEADRDHVMLSITISDTGMGIKKESLPYLFDAFKRVDEQKNRYIEGTGLGLSIVKQLVELMDGTITVNSVYGEGSSFTVVLKQAVSDHKAIGELNIHNQAAVKRSQYESTFKAPDARILIVDDNEMNLEVESMLLVETEIIVDKALSGKEALDRALDVKYDVILMDHLMPQMDGVECLERLRTQAGGLNRTTPIVVLTANAGGENRDLYARAGFDGYLVKPVSGEALEKTLMKHISQDKMVISDSILSMRDDINASSGYSGKTSVVITSTGMCDLPDSIVSKLNLKLISFFIHTDEGVFKDGSQMDANEFLRYIHSGKNAYSAPPDESAYTEFFSSALKRAHHLIHIALTPTMSEDYRIACEAAKAFDNVTVINSGCLSSATGILVLIAHKLVQQNLPFQDIVDELEEVSKRLRCSFIVDTTSYLAKKGHISNKIDFMARMLNLHPTINSMNDKSGLGAVRIGSTKRAYKRYIASAFPVDIIPDPEVVFVTYVDVPTETLIWIKEEISKYAYFENVVFQQASAAISSNCGPGTFGILYFIKSNKSYNIASYIEDSIHDGSAADVPEEKPDRSKALKPAFVDDPESTSHIMEDVAEADERNVEEDTHILYVDADAGKQSDAGSEWYDSIEGINGQTAIKNSGSEEAFKMVLKIFYESIENKHSEIEGYYSDSDWQNYTIKVHALKSSAKLIGAASLAEEAQKLENAGKEGDLSYINDHHAPFMKEYLAFGDRLKPIFEEVKDEESDHGTDNAGSEKSDKPLADEFLLESIYEGLQEAADNMDYDSIEEIFNELEGYSLSENDEKKLKAIRDKAESFDYDSILEIIGS